jgi:hypothetical protein
MKKHKDLPIKLKRIFKDMGVNFNDYELVKSNYENFTVRDLRTGNVLLPIRY